MGSTLYSYRWKPKEGRNRDKRPKSFKTAEAVKAWAEKNKLKDYSIKNLGTEKYPKYQIVLK
jgi:hypothetical protein